MACWQRLGQPLGLGAYLARTPGRWGHHISTLMCNEDRTASWGLCLLQSTCCDRASAGLACSHGAAVSARLVPQTKSQLLSLLAPDPVCNCRLGTVALTKTQLVRSGTCTYARLGCHAHE